MIKLSNKHYLILNILTIVVEFAILMLVKNGVIRSDYWLDVGVNFAVYLSVIAVEALLLYLTFKVVGENNQKSLLISQLVIFPIIFIVLLYKLTVFYDW